MCYDGKCLHCIEVETGALIYAIFNIITNSLGTVISIGASIYLNAATQHVVRGAEQQGNAPVVAEAYLIGVTFTTVLNILAVAFGISFSFAVCLIVGLCKRRASLVKSYFVYGMVKMILSVTVSIILFVKAPLYPEAVLIILVANVIYGLILLMVHNSYKKFDSELRWNNLTTPLTPVYKL